MKAFRSAALASNSLTQRCAAAQAAAAARASGVGGLGLGGALSKLGGTVSAFVSSSGGPEAPDKDH